MSPAAWTSVVALFGALLAAMSGAYATNQARKARTATVDKDIFDAKAEIRELERENDKERRRRRDLEEAVHRIAQALHRAGIEIPPDVQSLLRPPPGTGTGPT
jgi:uncharacterized membrane protein